MRLCAYDGNMNVVIEAETTIFSVGMDFLEISNYNACHMVYQTLSKKFQKPRDQRFQIHDTIKMEKIPKNVDSVNPISIISFSIAELSSLYLR